MTATYDQSTVAGLTADQKSLPILSRRRMNPHVADDAGRSWLGVIRRALDHMQRLEHLFDPQVSQQVWKLDEGYEKSGASILILSACSSS